MTRIGPYTLHVIETGRFALDGGAMFGVVPRTLWERRITPDERNRIPMNMRCLLIESSGRLILVDSGLGDKYDAKFAGIYAVNHERYDLHRSLRTAGFSASDVTDVVLTHLHFDHCGGSTRRVGDRILPAFENAEYYVQRSHWEWAKNPNVRERASFLEDNLAPLEASGRLRLLDGEGELWPGIEVFVVNGHTEGQQLVKISGDGRTLVFVADLLPTSAHLPIPWVMAYDVRPLVTFEEKKSFLERGAALGWHVMFEHDPVVEVATLKKGGSRVEAVEPRPLHEL